MVIFSLYIALLCLFFNDKNIHWKSLFINYKCQAHILLFFHAPNRFFTAVLSQIFSKINTEAKGTGVIAASTVSFSRRLCVWRSNFSSSPLLQILPNQDVFFQFFPNFPCFLFHIPFCRGIKWSIHFVWYVSSRSSPSSVIWKNTRCLQNYALHLGFEIRNFKSDLVVGHNALGC